MESILTSIKVMLGITAECTDFDGPIIAHINTALMPLRQNGIGPETGFMVTNEMDTWNSFLGEWGVENLQAVKTYVYCKVKMIFDPPQSSTHLEALKSTVAELEWRLNVQVDINNEEV